MKNHHWIALVQIDLTDSEAAEAKSTGIINREVTLKDIAYTGLGCYDCELSIEEAYGQPCSPPPKAEAKDE